MSTNNTIFKLARNKAILTVIAVVLYVLPNLIQDFHRIIGHSHISELVSPTNGFTVHQQSEKCLVCVFEFYTTTEPSDVCTETILKPCNYYYTETACNQADMLVFDYSRFRAPPIS